MASQYLEQAITANTERLQHRLQALVQLPGPDAGHLPPNQAYLMDDPLLIHPLLVLP
jgi:hypothetical protein